MCVCLGRVAAAQITGSPNAFFDFNDHNTSTAIAADLRASTSEWREARASGTAYALAFVRNNLYTASAGACFCGFVCLCVCDF